MLKNEETPQTLGRYRIDRVLGRGAMGVVYLAFDPHIQREVALKTIRSELLNANPDEAAAAPAHDLTSRFLNEARAAGRLVHPHIVSVYDYGDTGDTAYITMEYVRGESLAARLAQHRRAATRMAPARVLGWFAQLLDALSYAHDAGVIHRDIKPANLLIAQRGECKITDFGIAQLDTSHHTQAGTLIGTPSYMSPEQFTGEAVDARADLFSAGVVLYEMLTGACPFTGTPAVVMRQVLNDMPGAPSGLAPDLPPALDAMVLKALAKRREDRFASASQWRAALIALIDTMQHADDADDIDRTIVTMTEPAPAFELPQADAQAASMQWPPELLARLEQRLASHVGPMATVLVRRAAAQAGDSQALSAQLAAHFPDDVARREFDALLAGHAGPVEGGASAATLDTALVDDATRRLAAYVGPIARIVASRAASRTNDAGTFYLRLVDAVPDEKDKAALRRELGLSAD